MYSSRRITICRVRRRLQAPLRQRVGQVLPVDDMGDDPFGCHQAGAGEVEGVRDVVAYVVAGDTQGDSCEVAAGGHVEVTVLEGAVDYFNPVTVTYEKTGQRQELLLVKDDGHWWIGLGDGDPAAGK